MFETLHGNLWAWYGLLVDGSFEANNKNSVRLVELDGNEKESFVSSSYYSPNFIITTVLLTWTVTNYFGKSPFQCTADQMINSFC